MVAISGAASRRHFFRAGGPLLLALVVAASGCASSPPSPRPQASDSFFKGLCEAIPLVCIPLLPVAVVEGIAARQEKSADRKKYVPEPPAPEPTRPHLEGAKFVTWLPRSDFSPSGSLLIDEASVENYGLHVVYGPLVVNIDEPVGDSTRSIQEDIAVNCATGEVEFSWRVSYDQPNAKGKIVTSQPASTAIAPGPELDAVKREFCKFDLKG